MASLTLQQIQDTLLEGAPEVHFPVIIMSAAVFKDILDVVSLGFFGIVGSIFLWIIIVLWLFGKSNYIKNQLIRKTIRRSWWLLFGAIPGVNFIPESIILVLLIYNHEKKIVKSFYELADRLSRGKINIKNTGEFSYNAI